MDLASEEKVVGEAKQRSAIKRLLTARNKNKVRWG